MSFYQQKQVRHKASGQIFNATPGLEISTEYEPYVEAHVVVPEVPEAPEAKRRGRPPKAAALDVDSAGDPSDGDT